MVTNILIGIAAAFLGALAVRLLGGPARATQVPPPVEDAPDTHPPSALDMDVRPDITRLEAQMIELRMAVAEGIQHVERVEKRIKGTIRRARKEFADEGYEHAGLEAENSELQHLDGTGGPEGGMLPMPEELGEAQSSIPGVTVAQLRTIRGVR